MTNHNKNYDLIMSSRTLATAHHVYANTLHLLQDILDTTHFALAIIQMRPNPSSDIHEKLLYFLTWSKTAAHHSTVHSSLYANFTNEQKTSLDSLYMHCQAQVRLLAETLLNSC
jgi:hypothetical protein